jgi:hypothetical protein
MANKSFDDNVHLVVLVDRKFYLNTVHKHLGSKRPLDSLVRELLQTWAAEQAVSDGRYPGWRYHRRHEALIVRSEAEDFALGPEWSTAPPFPRNFYHPKYGMRVITTADEEDALNSEGGWSDKKIVATAEMLAEFRKRQKVAKTNAAKAPEPASAPVAKAPEPTETQPANAQPVSTSAAATAAPVK